MTMSAFRSAPRMGHLDRVKQICGYLSKMRQGSAILFRTEEPDFSDFPRTEYDWEFSVYRGSKEALPEDAHEPLDTDGWKRFHSLSKRAKKMLRMVNPSKLRSYKTCKKYMYLWFRDPSRL
jgi:hypothetical protein